MCRPLPHQHVTVEPFFQMLVRAVRAGVHKPTAGMRGLRDSNYDLLPLRELPQAVADRMREDWKYQQQFWNTAI